MSHSKPFAHSGVMSSQELALDLDTNRFCNLEERGKVGVEGSSGRVGVGGLNGVSSFNEEEGVTGCFLTLSGEFGAHGRDLE